MAYQKRDEFAQSLKKARASGLMTVGEVADLYGLHYRRLMGILIHEDNNAPGPTLILRGGRLRLYDPQEIDAWRGNRDLKELPFVRVATFYRVGPNVNGEAVNGKFYEHGVGGKAEGGLLRLAVEFYKGLRMVG
jgi:hypothetical protein